MSTEIILIRFGGMKHCSSHSTDYRLLWKHKTCEITPCLSSLCTLMH